MSQSDEQVLGNIPVTAKLALGSERLWLFLTSTRFIVAHVGKRGAGALMGAPLFGKLSAALEDVFKGGGESRKRRRIVALAPNEILNADRDNFQIRYGDVIRAELEDIGNRVRIVVLTRDEKFQFLTLAEYGPVLELFQKTLGEKLAVG